MVIPSPSSNWKTGALCSTFSVRGWNGIPSFRRISGCNWATWAKFMRLTRLDPSLLQPPSAALRANVPQITALNAKASLRCAITGTTGQQTLHVYVLDQRGKPVPGAASAAVVRFPSGNRSVTLPRDRCQRSRAGDVRSGQAQSGPVGCCPGEGILDSAGSRDADLVLCVVVDPPKVRVTKKRPLRDYLAGVVISDTAHISCDMRRVYFLASACLGSCSSFPRPSLPSQ